MLTRALARKGARPVGRVLITILSGYCKHHSEIKGFFPGGYDGWVSFLASGMGNLWESLYNHCFSKFGSLMEQASLAVKRWCNCVLFK